MANVDIKKVIRKSQSTTRQGAMPTSEYKFPYIKANWKIKAQVSME